MLSFARPPGQAKVAAKLKAAQLAAEIAEMRRKIQVQELRQAGKLVPPVRMMPSFCIEAYKFGEHWCWKSGVRNWVCTVSTKTLGRLNRRWCVVQSGHSTHHVLDEVHSSTGGD